jgi:hypothetical protein
MLHKIIVVGHLNISDRACANYIFACREVHDRKGNAGRCSSILAIPVSLPIIAYI